MAELIIFLVAGLVAGLVIGILREVGEQRRLGRMAQEIRALCL